jgi:putative phosphoribosyl transferase
VIKVLLQGARYWRTIASGFATMTVVGPFPDRRTAGRALAEVLAQKDLPAPVVLALPRGGVAVGVEIALALKAPLEVVLVRKIGVPLQPELAAAAVVDGAEPEIVTNEEVVELAGLSRDYIAVEAKRALAEIERRRHLYVQEHQRVALEGRTGILVDDGIATGASVRAALKAIRRKGPRGLILAVPVAPVEAVEELKGEVDEVVCLSTPKPFIAIGVHYLDFRQVSDAEVIALVAEAAESGPRLADARAADPGRRSGR